MTSKNLIKRFAYLILLQSVLCVLIIPGNAAADMSVSKPRKFRFTGLVELNYYNYRISSTYVNNSSSTNWNSFEQRYTLGATGYIYHPKLMLFSTHVVYSDKDFRDQSSAKSSQTSIGYGISTTFLPYRPVSLEVNAMRSVSTIEGWGTSPFDATSTSYGAKLYLTKSNLPSTRIEYEHWEYITESDNTNLSAKTTTHITDKTEMDTTGFHMNGTIKKLKTNYLFDSTFLKYSSSARESTAQNYRLSTFSSFSPRNTLSTNFTYSDYDISSIMSFGTTLNLSPVNRFYHSYSYSYIFSDSGTEKGQSFFHTVAALFNYRFNSFFRGRTNLTYRIGERSGTEQSFYDGDFNLEYKRPVKGLLATTNYGFSYSAKQKENEHFRYYDHTLGLGLETRNLSMGKIYSSYNLSYRDYESNYKIPQDPERTEQFHSQSHRFRSGVTGRGPGRTHWTVEAEGHYFDIKNGVKPAKLAFWSQGGEWSEHIRHYTMSGEVGHPLGTRGSATLRSSYTTGESDSKEVQRYRYEGTVNYPIARNLSFTGWFREEWWSNGWYSSDINAHSTKIREYQLDTYYRLNKLTLSLEYNVSKDENSSLREIKHLFIRLSRKF